MDIPQSLKQYVLTEEVLKTFQDDGYEIFRLEDTTLASDDHMGMLTLERDVSGYVVNLFEVFIPLIQLEETDTATVHWTIIKK